MTTIAFNVALFRQQFPAFASETTYPDATLQVYFTTGSCFVSTQDYGCLSGDCRVLALNAMTAHLCRLNEMIVAGNQPGVVTSSSVGSVSVSLTPPPFGTSEWSYWLNQTPYGQQVQVLLEQSAVGGLYVGGSCERQGFRKYGGVF